MPPVFCPLGNSAGPRPGIASPRRRAHPQGAIIQGDGIAAPIQQAQALAGTGLQQHLAVGLRREEGEVRQGAPIGHPHHALGQPKAQQQAAEADQQAQAQGEGSGVGHRPSGSRWRGGVLSV